MYIEVPVFLIYFCFLLSVAVTTNFLMYRTCYVILGYNETDCSLLGSNSLDPRKIVLEENVQPITTLILMTSSIINSTIPVICSLFVGPWSNKYGRKPVILVSLIGYFLSYIFIAVISLIPWISPWWWLISCTISSLGGGITTLLTVCFCYISDITNDENRSFRMGIIHLFTSLGCLLGTVLCSYILNIFGYMGTYSLCAFVNLLAIIYTYFFLPESVNEVQTEGAIKNLFDVQIIVQVFKTCFKRRENNDRLVLCLIITVLFSYIFVTLSESSIFFLFMRDKFDWSLEKFTLYSTISSLYTTIGNFFGIYFMSHFLKMNDIILLIISQISLSCSYVIFGVAKNDGDIYIGTLCRFLVNLVGPLGRSEISKIIPSHELGEVFSFTTSLESISQVVSSPLYTYVYNKTLTTNPSTYNFLSVALLGFSIIIGCFTLMIQKFRTPLDVRVDT